MSDVALLIRQAEEYGTTFVLRENSRVVLRAPSPLPDELLAELKEAKHEIVAELKRQLKLEAGYRLLEEWRRTSIPSWRRILQETIDSQDAKREEYARWMLREMLKDPEYREEA